MRMTVHPLIGRSFLWVYRLSYLAPLALLFWLSVGKWIAAVIAALWPVWIMLVWLFETAVLGERLGLTVTRRARDAMRDAAVGDVDAQYRLAGYYDRGEQGLNGARNSHEKALEWYEKAAAQGHVHAAFDLAERYMGVLSGEPFLPDEMPALPADSTYHERRQERINAGMVARRRAAHWYRMAAEQGHVTARGRLGDMYRTGNGVAKNSTTARKWLSLALAAGDTGEGEPADDIVAAEHRADIRFWRFGLDQIEAGMSEEGSGR